MKKLFSFSLLLSLISVTTFAQVSLSLSDVSETLKIKVDADTNKIAVFEDDNSLWLVSEKSDTVTLDIPSDIRKKYNIESGEALMVNGGAGARVQFKNKPNYDLSIVDEAKYTIPLSVISLKEGLVVSGVDQPKVLLAQSPILKKSFSVIPYGKDSAQSAEIHTDGSSKLSTRAGYVFRSKSDGALKSLYKNQQQFLADNNQSLLSMAKLSSQKRESVLTTKRAGTKIEATPLQRIDVNTVTAVNKADTEFVDTSLFGDTSEDEAYENLAAPSFAAIKPIKGEAQYVGTMPNNTKEKENAQANNFVKDTDALARALDKVSSARQKMSNIDMPKVKHKKFDVQKKSDSGFDALFGSNVFELEEGEEAEVQSNPAFTLVEETPEVGSYDEASKVAGEILDGTGILESDKGQAMLAKLSDINGNDPDAEFFMPDLDPTEPIFKVYGNGTEKAFQKFQHLTLQTIANASSQLKRQQYRLRLAKLYMSYKRAHEVLMVMDNMPKYDDSKQLRDTSARILSGASNLIMNRPEEALFFLDKTSENFEADRKLWQAVAYEMSDQDAKALDQFPDYIEQANDYPDYLKKEIYISYGRVLLRQEHLSELKKVMQALGGKIKTQQLPPEALILLARASILERNDDLAETLLAQVAASDNLEASFLAQYEFVSFLLQRGDLGRRQAIEHLENLRYMWRGGLVEQEILIKLGHMYVAKGDQRKGLERLKYHNIYFPDSGNIPKITGIMTSAFTDLYLDESANSELDALTLLGLYYDFRELTPSGKRGDQLIAQIGERLRRLGLYDDAIKVLEHQLKFRVKDERLKGVMGRNLARLYNLNRMYEESLVALNRTESPNFDEQLNAERRYIEVENYIGLKMFDKALANLNGMDQEKASKLRAKIGWLQSKYALVIKNHQSIFDDKYKLPVMWGDEEKVNFIQLAVAYNNLGQVRELESLKKRFKKQIESDEKIGQVLDFLLKDQGSDMMSNYETKEALWSKLTVALSAYHDFADYYDDFILDRETDRRDKDIFNRRMRQMSAPARY